MLDMQRVYDYLAQGRWFRRASLQGQFSLGSHRYGLGKGLADQQLEITFDPRTRELVCLSEDAGQKVRLPVRGLTKSDLMGELDPLVTLPTFQLALPFSPSAWREMMLANDGSLGFRRERPHMGVLRLGESAITLKVKVKALE